MDSTDLQADLILCYFHGSCQVLAFSTWSTIQGNEVAIRPGGRVNKTYLLGFLSELSLILKSLSYFLIWWLQPPNQKIKNAFQRQRRLD